MIKGIARQTAPRRAVHAAVVIALLLTFFVGNQTQAQPSATWSLLREQQLGSETMGTDYLFTRITAALPRADGSIVVAEGRNQPLRVFGANGQLLYRIGREGRGPGEFAGLQEIGLIRDTVYTTDVSLRRTTLFSGDGTLIFTLPWDVSPAGGAASGNLIRGLFADGTGWGEVARGAGAIGGPELPKAILRLTRTARALDTLAVVSTAHTLFSIADGPTVNFGVQRFSDAPLIVSASHLSRLYVVDRAVATTKQRGTVRVIAVSAAGDTSWVRGFIYEPRPLEKRVADSVAERTSRGMARAGATAAQVRSVLFLPHYRPPVTSAFTATEGTLWLRREEGRASVEYWIVDASGTLRAALIVPANVMLLAARDDLVWGSETNSDGVPTIVRFRVRR